MPEDRRGGPDALMRVLWMSREKVVMLLLGDLRLE